MVSIPWYRGKITRNDKLPQNCYIGWQVTFDCGKVMYQYRKPTKALRDLEPVDPNKPFLTEKEVLAR